MISFEPLQITLIKKKISKMEFIEMTGVSSSTAARMWRDEYIAMRIIDHICNVLECDLSEVITHIPTPNYSRKLIDMTNGHDDKDQQ
ncbi:helix-turn-helix transcriptional regulator [Paenibacillus polymyxa]|uniref:helix-turn-helix domain-containing protein n=1 Tax=Paenibacillus polymyxa TaxID=1406 RepID=UPI002AB45C9A|nr:helix-turn-helix transcriptional regulator [Paenibacillus polymyxa]MDY8023404.1 helix-turn-helix transcriptional regulator [Paenibacillus polymyxa]